MRPEFSRLVTAPGPDGDRTWHLLDNGPVLAAAGVTPRLTLLCVHGNPTWSYLWRKLVSAAADAPQHAVRVIAVDQLDMGFSERTGSSRSLPTRIADLSALTGQLGIDTQVVTVGHDWGGVVSLGWAVDHPDQLAGVILTNTAVHHPAGEPIPAPLRLALAKGVLPRGTVTTPAFLQTTLALGHPALSPETKTAYSAPYPNSAQRGGIGAFVADIPVNDSHPSFAELDRVATGVRELTVPALLLWGPKDPIFDDRYLRDLIARLPHADVHRFEGAGHLLAEDVDIATPILDWLAEGLLAAQPCGREATAEAGSGPSAEPLWAQLEQRADDDSTAFVEMAPPGLKRRRVVSWRRLNDQVLALAAGLHASGVRPGHRVSLLVPPGADLTALIYACLRIGAIVVIADAGLGVKGLSRAVRGAGPDYIVAIARGLAAARAFGWPGTKISVEPLNQTTRRALGVELTLPDLLRRGIDAELPAPPAADVTAAILFTSGSTGPAKGVVYTHRQLEAMRDALAGRFDIGPGTGLVAGFAPFALLGPALGATSVSPDMDVTAPRTLTARALAEAAQAVEATVVFAAPAALRNVLATAGDLDHTGRRALEQVRIVLSAGAPIPEPLLTRMAGLTPNASLHTPYGMTEALLVTDISLDQIRAAGSSEGVCVGEPAGPVQVAIAAFDAEGVPSAELTNSPGVSGEIVISAPHMKDHYDRLWITQRLSAANPGWHRTGDIGHLDGDGRLWVEGRLAHVITAPDGIHTPVGPEQRIEALDQVGSAAVVGIGPPGAQQVVVIVTPARGGTARRPRLALPGRRPRLAGTTLAAQVRKAAGIPVAAVFVLPQLPTDIRHDSKIDRARLAAWADRVLAGGRLTRP
ncbi:alpha/beta fold hydrolase [Saxibacter everestensis]|uniref:Alpha/beta fold hydrolase n=1 Tax=Saxibacter everestensis TaxID=2909229 RepID=A0ABY8QYM7_9MICO|nr:alpha/beta fold hydrolase [Brevibacteriaceae bacterium ZFBP1038]